MICEIAVTSHRNCSTAFFVTFSMKCGCDPNAFYVAGKTLILEQTLVCFSQHLDGLREACMAGLRQAGCKLSEKRQFCLRVPISTSVLALRILQLQHLKVNFGLGKFFCFIFFVFFY